MDEDMNDPLMRYPFYVKALEFYFYERPLA